jgi:hypothetical protein
MSHPTRKPSAHPLVVHPACHAVLHNLILQETHKYQMRPPLSISAKYQHFTHPSQISALLREPHPLDMVTDQFGDEFQSPDRYSVFIHACQHKVDSDKLAFDEALVTWCHNGQHQALALWFSVVHEFVIDLVNRYRTESTNRSRAEVRNSCASFVVSWSFSHLQSMAASADGKHLQTAGSISDCDAGEDGTSPWIPITLVMLDSDCSICFAAAYRPVSAYASSILVDEL